MIDDTAYVLYETGNDTPWESDGIEFVDSPDFVIHRAPYEGFYWYKYEGIIVEENTDAVSLLQWGMARRKRFLLCTPWEGAQIAFADDGTVLRDFGDGSTPQSARGYLVAEGDRIYTVNRYYLVDSGLAQADDELFAGVCKVPNMQYKGEFNPWKEDKIFFVTDAVIRKTDSVGLYQIVEGRVRKTRSARDLLREGYARPLAERKQYYYARYCREVATKTPLARGDFLAAFRRALPAELELDFEPDFDLFSLWDAAITYDYLSMGVVPSNKFGLVHLPVRSPETVARYDAYVDAVQGLFARATQLDGENGRRYLDLVERMRTLSSKCQYLLASAEYRQWNTLLSRARQTNFARYFRRTVVPDDKWQLVSASATQLAAEYEAVQTLQADVERASCADRQSLVRAFESIAAPTGGVLADRERAAQAVRQFEAHPFVTAGTAMEGLATVSKELRTQFDAIDEVVNERAMLDAYIAHMSEVKDYIAGTRGWARWTAVVRHRARGVKLVRYDYRITRLKSTLTYAGYTWDAQGAYTLYVNGSVEYVFNEMLVYLGMATFN